MTGAGPQHPTPHLLPGRATTNRAAEPPDENPKPENNKPLFLRSGTMSKFSRVILGLVVTAFAGAAALSPTPSFSQENTAKIRTGTLTCQGKGRIGLLIGSRETLDCTYVPNGDRPKRRLVGTVTNVGLDVGIKGPSVMVWGVLGSTAALPSDALSGSFVGAAADASLGLGAGAKVLIGGNNKSVVLQPLSVQGQTGVNLAIGVTGLRLDPR
jgi:hypothetical protein